MKFYPRKWAQYENAKPGTMKLVPPKYRMETLRKDYEYMAEMMFGTYLKFDDLMSYIAILEKEINQL